MRTRHSFLLSLFIVSVLSLITIQAANPPLRRNNNNNKEGNTKYALQQQAAAAAQTGSRVPIVVCLGDSITYGIGITADKRANYSYPGKLQSLLTTDYLRSNWTVLNYGVTGATATNGSRLTYVKTKNHVFASKITPQVVIMMLGTNDAMLKLSPKFYQRSYIDLIKGYQNLTSRPQILLLTPPWQNLNTERYKNVIMDPYVSIVKEIGKTYNLPVVDIFSLFVGKDDYLADGLHPNLKGYELIAKSVYRAIVINQIYAFELQGQRTTNGNLKQTVTKKKPTSPGGLFGFNAVNNNKEKTAASSTNKKALPATGYVVSNPAKTQTGPAIVASTVTPDAVAMAAATATSSGSQQKGTSITPATNNAATANSATALPGVPMGTVNPSVTAGMNTKSASAISNSVLNNNLPVGMDNKVDTMKPFIPTAINGNTGTGGVGTTNAVDGNNGGIQKQQPQSKALLLTGNLRPNQATMTASYKATQANNNNLMQQQRQQQQNLIKPASPAEQQQQMISNLRKKTNRSQRGPTFNAAVLN